MPTIRETILAALPTRLSALHAAVLRCDVLPERVPAEGLLILARIPDYKTTRVVDLLQWKTATQGSQTGRLRFFQIIEIEMVSEAKAISI